ncbi:MAG: hypothetical protein FWC67_05165, partial [Defluviitaleaceae bacterium]|nr:hypothetical protein [Defluviitaleaceae bacterium]
MKKIQAIAIVVFGIVPVVGVSIAIMAGTRPINVDINDDNLRVRGMYGITLHFDDILSVELLEESMATLRPGTRRNGIGTSNTLRGHFHAGLLHVQNPAVGPTIRISRPGSGPLFISKNDAQDTRHLYESILNSISY